MLLAIDLDEDFVDVESIAVAAVLSFQPSSIQRSKLDAPEADRLPSDNDASLSQEIFNIPVAEIESVVEPDGITDDIWGEPVALVGIHWPILSIWDS